MTELRLTLEKQRDDIGKLFKQILFSNTRKPSYNTVSNTNNDNIDINTNNDDMNSNTDNNNIGSITDDDVDESDTEQEMNYIDNRDDNEDIEELTLNLRCSSAKSTRSPKSSNPKRSDSSDTTGVAPIFSPSTCSQVEDLKDPFVRSLTSRHSLTQLHEWLNSIKCLVNTSISMVTSKHLDLDLTQLTVTELSLNTLPFSTQLNRGHHHLAWSGYAKYENFKPWKTKQSFHLRHPHCWFASSPQLLQVRQLPCPQQRANMNIATFIKIQGQQALR